MAVYFNFGIADNSSSVISYSELTDYLIALQVKDKSD